MLALEKVSAGYSVSPVIHDISLRLEKGEFVALIGANGAGKTTLIRVISNLILPLRGRVLFNGKDITGLPVHGIVNLGIVQVPEGRQLFPLMTVRDNLLTGGLNQRAKKNREQNLKFVFRLFPVLDNRKNQIAFTLSGGEQQMLAIARALMANPEILILDEPSVGLAPMIVQQVLGMCCQVGESGVTVLMAEQNVRGALSVSQRAYVLENGRIALEGNSVDLMGNPKIKESYLGL